MEGVKKKILDHLNKNDSLLKHSLILFIGSMVGNIFGYIFQLYMSIALDPVGFGILGALFSMIYIFSSAISPISTTLTNFISRYREKNYYGKIKGLFISSLKLNLIIALIIFIAFVAFGFVLADFLRIENMILIYLLSFCIGISFISSSFSGTITGLQDFKKISYYNALSAIFKLAIGIILVSLGFWVVGAMFAVILASILSLLIFYKPIKSLLIFNAEKTHHIELIKYAIPVFFTSLIASLIINLDMILVKHYFSSELAGSYAAAALIAKIILFASAPIVAVMFPKIAAFHESNKDTSQLLRSTLFYTGLIAFGVSVVYFLFPKSIVNILFGDKYYSISNIIPVFGIAIAFYSLLYIFYQYNLAIKRFNFIYFSSLIIILETVLIVLFHKSLADVVWILTAINLISILFFMIYNRKDIFKISRTFSEKFKL